MRRGILKGGRLPTLSPEIINSGTTLEGSNLAPLRLNPPNQALFPAPKADFLNSSSVGGKKRRKKRKGSKRRTMKRRTMKRKTMKRRTMKRKSMKRKRH